MDFIKIPYYKPDDTVGDAAIRISSIRRFTTSVEDDRGGTSIVLNNGSVFSSPMSVAKIYDLIWQTELANQFREPTKKMKGGEDYA